MKTLMAMIFLLVLNTAGYAQVQRNRTVVWDYPGDISQVTEFRLYYGTTPGGPYGLGRVVIPVGTLTATAILPKGTYYFVCTAANPDSESPYSNEAQTIVYDNSQKPINLRITVGP